MGKSMVRSRAFVAILCLVIEALAALCAEVPPGPKWLQTAVFYQIYPQSYFDSNGDGIGDLPDIAAKLDYVRSVGCKAIWINPIFEKCSGNSSKRIVEDSPLFAVRQNTLSYHCIIRIFRHYQEPTINLFSR